MRIKSNFKKQNRRISDMTPKYEDDLMSVGRKGGKVSREREEIHQIDMELRNLTYR